MKYIYSLSILLGFTFLGELFHILISLPIPAAVYGLALLFAALSLKIVKLEQVKTVSQFFISIMPVLFVAPAVNLLESWRAIADNLFAIAVILTVSTGLVFAVAGKITQALLAKEVQEHG